MHGLCIRDSIGAQLQLALAKSDSEQLARTIAEEQLSEAEKEKTMKDLELKEAKQSHKSEMARKELAITNVRIHTCLASLAEDSQLCSSALTQIALSYVYNAFLLMEVNSY